MTDKLAHQKDVQGALSLGSATLGLSALGAKGASLGIDRASKKPLRAHAKPSMVLTPKVARALDKGSIGLVTLGAGVGGISGYNFAAIQRAEAKRERENVVKAETAVKPKPKKKLTLAERKEQKGAMIGGAAAGTAGAAVAPLFFESGRNPLAKPSSGPRWYDERTGGAGHNTSAYFKRKAAPKGGRPADPGVPPTPPQPPIYEETLGPKASDKARYQYKQANERIIYLREHPVDHAGRSTTADREAAESLKNRFHAKYGTTRGRQTHPGTPGHPGRPAKPAVPPKKAPWGWRAAHATMGGPKRTTAILGAGLLAGGAAVGTGLGANAARAKRQERKEKKIMFGKSAFGVVHKKDTWSESEREKHYRLMDKKPVARLGEPDPHDWKSDLQRQPAPAKPAPKSYPKTGGIDPERQRLRRMGRWEDAAATSAAATGLGAAGVAAAPKATLKLRDAATRKEGQWTVRAGQKYHKRKYVKTKTRGRFAQAAGAARKVSTAAGRANVRLTHVPTGKIALGAAAASAGLAGGTVAIRQYRKKNGRSYSDWWDG